MPDCFHISNNLSYAFQTLNNLTLIINIHHVIYMEKKTTIIQVLETNQLQIVQRLSPSPFQILLSKFLEVLLLVFCLHQPYLVDRDINPPNKCCYINTSKNCRSNFGQIFLVLFSSLFNH